jgi:hypothetical protein
MERAIGANNWTCALCFDFAVLLADRAFRQSPDIQRLSIHHFPHWCRHSHRSGVHAVVLNIDSFQAAILKSLLLSGLLECPSYLTPMASLAGQGGYDRYRTYAQSNVRFTPKSGHQLSALGSPLSAISRHSALIR